MLKRMKYRIFILVSCLFGLSVFEGGARPPLLAGQKLTANQVKQQFAWEKIKLEDIKLDTLTPLGRTTLELPHMKWSHVQTQHFYIHFEHGMFAKRVGRLAEFLYWYIGEDLSDGEEVYTERSHIFIFRKAEVWKQFVTGTAQAKGWFASFVQGPVMYLQEMKSKTGSNNVLSHEMTHLVLNRYFRRSIPNWINEGLAEWYGDFGRAAYKGVRRSPKKLFRNARADYPLEALISSSAYPEDPKEVSSFYRTSKLLVGFLRVEKGEEPFQAYIKDILKGEAFEAATLKHFKYEHIEEMLREFEKFID